MLIYLIYKKVCSFFDFNALSMNVMSFIGVNRLGFLHDHIFDRLAIALGFLPTIEFIYQLFWRSVKKTIGNNLLNVQLLNRENEPF